MSVRSFAPVYLPHAPHAPHAPQPTIISNGSHSHPEFGSKELLEKVDAQIGRMWGNIIDNNGIIVTTQKAQQVIVQQNADVLQRLEQLEGNIKNMNNGMVEQRVTDQTIIDLKEAHRQQIVKLQEQLRSALAAAPK
jgi:3-methyladenine DNA glycosylase Tag